MANEKITVAQLATGTPEANVTQQCLDFLRAHGWRPLRMNRGLMVHGDRKITIGEPGMCDWLLVSYFGGPDSRMTYTVWLEVKQPNSRERCICATKKPRQRCTPCDQRNWQSAERARGGRVVVVDSLEMLMAGEWWK